jgi:splicing factor 3B subunit 2
MERVLKFRDNQHEEDRVTKLHSGGGGGGHQTDSGIEQNDDYDDESDEESTPQNGLSRKAKKQIDKRRRRRAKKKTKSTAPPPPPPPAPVAEHHRKESSKNDERKNKKKYDSDDDDDQTNGNVEIEYVQEDIPVKRGDGYYSHFVKVFENFKLDQNADENVEYYYNKYGKKVLGTKILLPRDKTNLDENEEDDDEKETNNYDKKKKDLDDEEQNKKKSKKQLKRETRLSVAQLKQLVIRPDVVEMFDVTAKDPKILVHLKVSHALFF